MKSWRRKPSTWHDFPGWIWRIYAGDNFNTNYWGNVYGFGGRYWRSNTTAKIMWGSQKERKSTSGERKWEIKSNIWTKHFSTSGRRKPRTCRLPKKGFAKWLHADELVCTLSSGAWEVFRGCPRDPGSWNLAAQGCEDPREDPRPVRVPSPGSMCQCGRTFKQCIENKFSLTILAESSECYENV